MSIQESMHGGYTSHNNNIHHTLYQKHIGSHERLYTVHMWQVMDYIHHRVRMLYKVHKTSKLFRSRVQTELVQYYNYTYQYNHTDANSETASGQQKMPSTQKSQSGFSCICFYKRTSTYIHMHVHTSTTKRLKNFTHACNQTNKR